MSILFRYRRFPVQHPIIPLRGRRERPRPLIPMALAGPIGQRALDAVLDTGADDTIFSDGIAAEVGIDLRDAPQGSGKGVGGERIPLRYAEVTLRITDGREFRKWLGWVGFTAVNLGRPLLGFAGFLEYFTATFYGDREEVKLSANRKFRGKRTIARPR